MIYKNPPTNLQNQQEVILTRADSEFIEKLSNRIDQYKTLPYNLPIQLYIDIIKESFLTFCRYGYNKSQETKLFFLPISEIHKFGNVQSVDYNPYMSTNGDLPRSNNSAESLSPSIINDTSKYNKDLTGNIRYNNPKTGFLGYRIKLFPNINYIIDVLETNNNKTFSSKTLLDNLTYQTQVSPYGQSLVGINSSLYIIDMVCQMTLMQNIESILNKGIPFNYNNMTHTLSIMSEVNNSLILKCSCNINIEYFYNDDLFVRFVYERLCKELRRRIGGHIIEIVGGVTINIDELYDYSDIEKIEEGLKMGSGVGDIILMR
jgi:hypothetical protein